MKDLLSKFFRGRGIQISLILVLLAVLVSINAVCDEKGSGKNDKPGDKPGDKPPVKNSRIIKQFSSVIDTVNSGSMSELLSIFKYSAARITAVGKGGVILTSSNGGLNWKQRFNSDTRDLHAVTMLNPRTYIACGVGGVILRTNDFGSSWSKIPSPDSIATIKSISFADTMIGFAANGTNKILKTVNSGLNWVEVTPSAVVIINSVFAVTGGRVFACGSSGNVFVSTDAGTTWMQKSTGFPADLNSISMAGNDFGKVAGNSGIILTTTNGGSNWIADSSFTTSNLRSISVSNPNLSFVCGDSILQRNQGSRWVTIGPKSIFHSMNIPGNYCNAVCDGDIYIVSTESCPCTHYIQLSPVEDPVLGLLWILDVSPDLTQNIRDRVKVEVGGNVEDNTITGWTQYVDNVNGNHTDPLSNEDLTIGNQTVQVTVGASQTTTECSFIEMPLSDVGGNDIRSIKFKITPIYPESSTTFLVPIYINFLDSPGNSCLVRKYIVDCNPNPSASTSQ